MISDEERREVAERLREDIPCNYDISQCELEEIVMHECGRGFICDSANEMECRRKTYNRLADLIDPDTTTDTTKTPELTTKCDCDALLALAEEMEFDGAEALDDEDWCKPLLVEYARRIRKALGVEK